MQWRGRSILITGASAGIGEALAYELADHADTLVLVARREERLQALKATLTTRRPDLRVLTVALDMARRDNQEALLTELNRHAITVDVLINNAGVGDQALFHQSDWHRQRAIIDLNVTSLASLTHLLLPDLLLEPAKSALVFVGSGAGLAWMPGSATYMASKHFVTALAMGLRAELQPLGLQVSLVCPGPVESEFDAVAGIQGGLAGGPSRATQISSQECAQAIVRGVERGDALILPGRRFKRLMTTYLLLPWGIRRRLVEADGRKLYRR